MKIETKYDQLALYRRMRSEHVESRSTVSYEVIGLQRDSSIEESNVRTERKSLQIVKIKFGYANMHQFLRKQTLTKTDRCESS